MEITIIGDKTLTIDVKDGTILDAIRKSGLIFVAPCGGKGRCGNCIVDIDVLGERKTVHACKTKIVDGMKVYLSSTEVENSKVNREIFDCDKVEGVALVIDIGTTTLVFYVIDLKEGVILSTKSILNPEASFGGDVISRIDYSNKHGIDEISNSLINVINEELSYFSKYDIDVIYATGNTTMLHYLAKEDPKTIGEYPYTPKFLDEKILLGKDIGVNVSKIILLPSFSSFVGGDLVSGCVDVDILNGNNLLIDLGTNGEMVLSKNGKIFVTSTAVGPAFEGMGIECGMGGVDGGISSVKESNGKLNIKVIGNIEPIGITGPGLVDIISIMKDRKIIDESGFMEEDRFYITEKVYICSKDIRNFQLAKSAIISGIKTLLNVADIKVDEIDNLYIAGGFGYYLGIKEAVNVGIIPSMFVGKIKVIGNSAGRGTIKYALKESNRIKAKELTKNIEVVDLNSQPMFMDEYIENMMF